MTQDKMRRIITACVSATTALLVFLMCFLIYQWIHMAVLDHEIKKVNDEIAYRTEIVEQKKYDAEYYESQFYLEMAWRRLQELENKK